MKKIVLYVFALVFTLSLLGCTVDNSGSNTTTRSAKWSLVRVTGGIAGIEVNLELGQITWIFDELNNNIIVEENVEGLSYGLPEGTYAYTIENINNAEFLFVDEVEYGDIEVGQNTFTIDQNNTSTNTNNADLFEYRFVR
jgi:hypothetical protein